MRNYPSFKSIEVINQNPYDLRPYVNTVLDQANWVLDRLPKATPLIIIVSEIHLRPFATGSVQSLIKRLDDSGIKTAYGIEQRHNYHGKRKERALLKEEIRVLKKFSFNNGAYGEAAEKSLYRACLDRGISFSFNDIASHWVDEDDNDSLVDLKDPFNKKLLAEHFPNSKQKVIFRNSSSVNDELGLKLSNFGIVERSLAHLRKTEAKVYLQHAGGAHALGTEDVVGGYLPYRNSLQHLYREAGYPVILANSYSRRTLRRELPVCARDKLGENIITVKGAYQRMVTRDENRILEKFEQNSGGLYTPRI